MDEVGQAIEQARKDWVINELDSYQDQKRILEEKEKERGILIYGLDGIRSPDLGADSHGTDVSDSTYKQAVNLTNVWKAVDELTAEIKGISAWIESIDAAINKLGPAGQIVIKAMHTKKPPPPHRKKTFRVLARETKYAESTLMNAHGPSLLKIYDILHVSRK